MVVIKVINSVPCFVAMNCTTNSSHSTKREKYQVSDGHSVFTFYGCVVGNCKYYHRNLVRHETNVRKIFGERICTSVPVTDCLQYVTAYHNQIYL